MTGDSARVKRYSADFSRYFRETCGDQAQFVWSCLTPDDIESLSNGINREALPAFIQSITDADQIRDEPYPFGCIDCQYYDEAGTTPYCDSVKKVIPINVLYLGCKRFTEKSLQT